MDYQKVIFSSEVLLYTKEEGSIFSIRVHLHNLQTVEVGK